MAAKRILLLDATGVTAYLWHGGHLKSEGEFQPDASGLQSLGEYLAKHRSSIFSLLADIAEEGFQLEDIPYVQGRDRTALLQRRLGQYFYGTTLSVALSLGRSKTGRRDEKILYAALTRAEALTPWLDVLSKAETILAGVYSVPLVLIECGSRLIGTLEPGLLITITRGGVRQSFFNEGKLQFSRLSQLATRGMEEVAIACANESKKIQQYLVGQRQIPRGTVLHSQILAHADQIPVLRQHCIGNADLRFDFTDLASAAKTEGLKDLPADSGAEPLLLHRLVVRPPHQQFAAPAERKFYRIWQIRFALTSVALVALTGCLLMASRIGLKSYELQQAMLLTNAEIAASTQRYNAILASLPKISLTPDNLRTVIGRFDELERNNPEITPMLIHLGQALNETPKVELLRLDWKSSERAGSNEKVGAGGTASRPAPAVSVSATHSGGTLDVVEITAQLPLGLSSDLRAQLDLIETFAAKLRSSRFEVRILNMPFDVESGKALKSRSETNAAQSALAPKFSLLVTRKP